MAGKEVTVVLVEDNVVDVMAVRRAFKKHKIANPIVLANDGVEALELLRNTSQPVPRPLLVLLDLNMPRMNGIEFLAELRADHELKTTIVFVLTTSNSDKDRVKSYGYNVAGYIVKGDVGKQFINLTNLLDQYWTLVVFPDE